MSAELDAQVLHTVESTYSAMMNQQPVNGVYYSGLQVYGPEISDAVDPDSIVHPKFASVFWPGGIPCNASGRFYTVIFKPGEEPDATGTAPRSTISSEDNASIQGNRNTLLSLAMSRRTIARWDTIRSQNVKGIAVPNVDVVMPDMCKIREAPLAAVSIYEVQRHRQIKAGQQIALLHFPSLLVNPASSLNALQGAVRDLIDSEKI